MATSIDEADAKLLKWLVKNPSAYPHEIEGMARRIYEAVIEQYQQRDQQMKSRLDGVYGALADAAATFSPDNPGDGVRALIAKIEQERQRLLESQQECEQLRRLGNRHRDEIENLNYLADSVECLRDIGRLVGCGHVDDADGRRQLINCVDQTLAQERQQADACRAEMVRAQEESAANKRAAAYWWARYYLHAEGERPRAFDEAVEEYAQEHERLLSELSRLRALLEDSCPQAVERLNNLLARIHRDGGHYTAEHGVEKSYADADLKVADAYARIAELEALIDHLRHPVSDEDAVQTGEISEAQWRFIQRDAETHGPRTSR